MDIFIKSRYRVEKDFSHDLSRGKEDEPGLDVMFNRPVQASISHPQTTQSQEQMNKMIYIPCLHSQTKVSPDYDKHQKPK